MKKGLVLYLHVHQPYRVRQYSIFDTADNHDYFNEESSSSGANNEVIFKKVVAKSYRPMNQLLEALLKQHPDFKLSLSITGTFIEQAELWAPEVLDDFKRLVATGRVEILAETYYHSLAYFYNLDEFEKQVKLHAQKIESIFGIRPTVFRNTELAYDDSLAKWAESAGYKGIIAEGWDGVLDGKSPNDVYRPIDTNNIGLLLKNYKLSDDIAFRFSNRDWPMWPLTVEKYIAWLNSSLEGHSVVNLFMDYETFGEHQWDDTGIFDFMRQLVGNWLNQENGSFYTVSGAIDTFDKQQSISMPRVVTWADTERDLTAWTGNSMQQEALRYLYEMRDDVMRSEDLSLINDWRKLQTSDHFYYMCTKWFTDGDVHAYFSPYDSPYDAFLYYLNVIRDMRWRLYYKDFKVGSNV